MKIEEAKEFLKKKIKVNNAVINEARKNGDINLIELTNDLDTESSAIETVLQALDRNSAGDIEVTDEKINELDSLILQIEEHRKHRSLSDTYLREHGRNTREDIGVGEYAYGIVLVPEDWVLPYLKELSNIWEKKLEKK